MLVVGGVVGMFFSGITGAATSSTQCSDRIDNDGDGRCDYGSGARCRDGSSPGDSGCSSKSDNSECNPSPEVCDGVDNDCDGSIDESLGSTTCGTGACQRTVQNCANGKAQTCTPGSPSPETCNNVDDNCDSFTDENLAQQCGVSNVGQCAFGTETCTAGFWGTCQGAIFPSTETCDGADNDCDGIVDEGCNCVNSQTRSCGNDVGQCAFGTQTCTSGNWSACVGEIGPSAETCDGVDNDCNGLIDESLGSTSCGTGECQRTITNCILGVPQTCTPGSPTSEVCDWLDNDCDGSIDESLGSTTCGTGGCLSTVLNCVNGQPQSCTPGLASSEVCDGVDNDCDGLVDESLGSTTCGTGACQRTVQNCVGGVSQACTPGFASTEVCGDGIDNDCDGSIDEGCFSDSCTDSDGGITYTINGNVSGYKNSARYTKYDSCLDSITVLEHYCSGVNALNITVACTAINKTSCSNGRCL